MTKINKALIHSCLYCSLLFHYASAWADQTAAESFFQTHIVNGSQSQLRFFWRDSQRQPYQSFSNLKQALAEQGQTLVFAMNGGIFQEDYTPLGLYIESGVTQYRLNSRKNAYGNFYIQPNGIFYLSKSGKAAIVPTSQFKPSVEINYATQSGPMLLVDGNINANLKAGSLSLRVRNGVGLLPDGRLLFAMSKGYINFYDFAHYFKQQGCQVALYLDGSVSRMYLEQHGSARDGNFGVIIAETRQADQ